MYINRPVDLYIIGCGGVGGYITNMLPIDASRSYTISRTWRR